METGIVDVPKRKDRYNQVIIIFGLVIFNYILFFIRTHEFPGFADAAAYADIADSLLHGEGYRQDFIEFFYNYFPGVTHQTDHWFSLYAFAIIPFYLILGKIGVAARLPSLFSYLGLIILSYHFGKHIFSRKVGFFAACTIAIHPAYVNFTVVGFPDMFFAFIALSAMYTFFLSLENDEYFLVCGLLLGLLYLVKPTGLLFFLDIFVIIVISYKGKYFTNKKFLLSILVYFLVISPYFIRNYVTFGDPFRANHKYTFFTVGYGENAFQDHFGYHLDDVPNFTKLVEKHGYTGILMKFYRTFMLIIFGGYYYGRQWGLTELLLPPLGIFAVIGFIKNLSNRKTDFIWITTVTYVITLSIILIHQYRYFFSHVVFLLFLAWEGFFFSAEQFKKRFVKLLPRYVNNARLSEKSAIIMGCALIIPMFFFYGTKHYTQFLYPDKYEFPYSDQKKLVKLYRLIDTHFSDDVVFMYLLAWPMHFFTNNRTVSTPYTTMEKLFDTCRKYDVDFLIDDYGFSPYFFYAFEEFQLIYFDEDGRTIYKLNLDNRDRSRGIYKLSTKFLFYNYRGKEQRKE